ncbi:TetR/AcrR family transcriptional regulator [Nonomuraea sp. NEAU-A123]|uniref:TetR/AcrR family transcriptional regulator n=1 Tax=Nonomuraea sp. NEAU-A123 TaxID=2839649 RepID=UPI001BE3D207|nr:TetR/AcrR family transcriptional regulator [Nonomuraea sp. NEAU-A123]MBT2227179.1 WHG domain-containing protein [Nonomuraea sp. NEAU-A123]
MATDSEPLTRRERLRRQTVEEIKQHAFELVDEGGVNHVSIASLGKAMGMTPPALYRYFPSREALLDALLIAAYADLGSTVAAAGREGREGTEREEAAQGAVGRVARIAHAYRRWALDHPRRYAMLFSDRSPGAEDPQEGVIAFNQGMLALLDALAEIASPSPSDGAPLDEALLGWAQAIGAPAGISTRALRVAVLGWSRIHGLVSLEISGAFDSMGMDAGHLLAAEIETVVAAAGAR